MVEAKAKLVGNVLRQRTGGVEAEIRELKREVATLRMERDILRKAVGFFAKDGQ